MYMYTYPLHIRILILFALFLHRHFNKIALRLWYTVEFLEKHIFSWKSTCHEEFILYQSNIVHHFFNCKYYHKEAKQSCSVIYKTIHSLFHFKHNLLQALEMVSDSDLLLNNSFKCIYVCDNEWCLSILVASLHKFSYFKMNVPLCIY